MSIGTLFVAAVIPGLIATAGYMLVVNIYARLNPGAAPPAERLDFREKLRATGEVWPVAMVFILVVTGIYGGWFSATEGAAIGAAATFLLAVTLGGMRWEGLKESLLSTTVTTGLIFVVLLGAELFSAALALSRLPAELSAVVATFDVAPIVILLMILLIYFILGCFMESLAMVLLTLPIFIPLMLSLDFGLGREQVLVWFGILVLMSVEVGMISPPFGLNLFVINAMAKDVPMGETYRGVMGFVASDFVRIILLALLPAISLWLPGLW
jgi:tripartite ATP-independent transporter DctM subunit